MRWLQSVGPVVGVGIVAACSAAPATTDGGPLDATTDRGTESDLGRGSSDAGELTDVGLDSGARDLGPVGADAADDLGRDAACIPASECATARGSGTSCVSVPVPDGIACTSVAGGICVVGTCVPRSGCGDGYREPGPHPLREGCDDGNVLDGDLCSSTCAPTSEHVPGARRGFDVPTLGAPDIAMDGAGRGLVVWTADDGTGMLSVNARRYDPLGAPAEPAPGYVVLHSGETSGTALQPNIAGLAHGGWAVVYSAYGGPILRVVHGDGSLGGEIAIGSSGITVAAVARVAALADGIVTVWVETGSPSDPADPLEGVRGRLFDESGVPRSASFTVPTDASAREHEPSVTAAVAGESEWFVTWTQSPLSAVTGGPVTVRGRRYRGAIARDGSDVQLVPAGVTPFVAALHDHDYALAWQFNGATADVHERILPEAMLPYDAATDIAIGATAADDFGPSVASAGGDDVIAAWRTETPRVGADIGVTAGLALTPEATALQAHLRASCAGEVSVSPARDRGVWVVWSERRTARLTTEPLEDVMVEYVPLD